MTDLLNNHTWSIEVDTLGDDCVSLEVAGWEDNSYADITLSVDEAVALSRALVKAAGKAAGLTPANGDALGHNGAYRSGKVET